MTSMKEYRDLYLVTDVLLLADIFEDFRKFSLTNYELDPAHYYTSPGLSFNACLKMTEAKIELLTDIDMLLFVEESIRGGVSMITHRFAQANNREMREYDPNLPSSYLQYYDCNNLYGYAMSQALPVGEFRWVDKDEHIDFSTLDDDSDLGYLIKCDLEYPSSLHDDHNDFPLAPEKIIVHDEFLSPYQKNLKSKTSSNGIKCVKLVPNFLPKSNYIVHSRNLKYYMQKGLILKEVHKVLEFKQAAWIKPYVDFNTEMRRLATSSSAKNFFKFLNNALYGRTMMNLRKQVNIRLTTSTTTARNLIAKPNFKSFKIINEDLSAIEMRKTTIKWNKPTFTGACVLELAKLHLYKFHYDVIKEKYGNQATLLFTDTDSLCYHIITENLYKDMNDFREYMDCSSFPKSNPCYDTRNDRRIGYFKDECSGVQPLEFVGLRSKMYSLLMPVDKDNKTAVKGVKKSFVKNHLTHDEFVRSLETHSKTKATFLCIRSKNHNLHTVNITKDCLNPYDDKRYLLDDGISSLSYGHYKILAP